MVNTERGCCGAPFVIGDSVIAFHCLYSKLFSVSNWAVAPIPLDRDVMFPRSKAQLEANLANEIAFDDAIAAHEKQVLSGLGGEQGSCVAFSAQGPQLTSS